MAEFYCKCCGEKYSSVSSLASGHCTRSSSGKHQLYEGEIGAYYYCCYCGSKYQTLSSLTHSHCSRNPDGNNHVPYEGGEKSKYT